MTTLTELATISTGLFIAGTGTLVLALAAAAAYGLVCLLVALRFTRGQRHSVGAVPAAARSLREVSFAARDGRARIDAWYRPVDGAAAPAVVFVHGKDACRGDELRTPTFALADALAAAGIAVLMIDLRGHGTSSPARMTYGEHERFDVLGAVDWLQAQGHRRIGVLGASMGAATALLAAASDPAIAAVVADSPFDDFGAMIERHFRSHTRLPRCFLIGALRLGRWLTGVDLRHVRPLAAAQRLSGRPVLVIHSAGDPYIPAAHGERIAAAIGTECWTTPSVGHVDSYRAQPAAYTQRVLGFFADALASAEIGAPRQVCVAA